MCKHGSSLVALGLLEPPCPVEPARDEWADHDGWRVELGPDPADRDWHDAQDHEHTADDFPRPTPGRRQPCPRPLKADDDEAHRVGG